MTIAVDLGRKATKQTNNIKQIINNISYLLYGSGYKYGSVSLDYDSRGMVPYL